MTEETKQEIMANGGGKLGEVRVRWAGRIQNTQKVAIKIKVLPQPYNFRMAILMVSWRK